MILYLRCFFRLVGFILISFFYGLPQSLIAVFYSRKFSSDLIYQNKCRIFGKRLRRVLQKFGPSFIKLGQALSTRPDAIGDEIANELSLLQDRLKPFPYSQVESAFEACLGCKIADAFAEFDKNATAAASIAQVHKAKTKDGHLVAVKVLRPNIQKLLEKDINFFKIVAKLVNYFHPRSKTLRPIDVVKQLEDSTRRELDLRLEAASCDQIRENLSSDTGIVIPKVFWQLTSKMVMTYEWVDGVGIQNREALINKGFDLHDIARKLSVTFFNQAFRDGFFHADLHPGNILVTQDGDIALVDFGIVGVLKSEERSFLAQMLYGFNERDYKKVADLHFEIGYVPKDKDPVLFALACRSIGEPIVGLPVNEISVGKLMKQLFEVAQSFDMEVQPQLVLLQKTMLTLEGVGFTVYPDVNMWKLAEPWIKQWAHENFGLKAVTVNLKKTALKFAKELPTTIERLDYIIEKVATNSFHKKKPVRELKVKVIPLMATLVLGILIGYLL